MVVETRRTEKPAPNSMDLLVFLDPKVIGFEHKSDRMAGKVDVFVVQKNDRGDQFNGKETEFTMNLTEDQFNQVMTEGLSHHEVVPLASQATELRIVVRDNASGTLGSVTVPLN
jgi:hypothetical protein